MTEQLRPQVVVGIVTYGKRWHLLEKVLEVLVNDVDVARIVVYNNGSSDPVSDLIERAEWQHQVMVIEGGSNRGSAVGYASVLRHLGTLPGANLVLLLDDDNRPKLGAIPAALDFWLALGKDSRNCVLMVRNDRPEQLHALATGLPLRHVNNSFLGFSIQQALRKRLGSRKTHHVERDAVQVDFAPYGGFMFHPLWLDKIGLPCEEYFVYADDHEYTTRITRAGGKIHLLGASKVEDLETSWFLKPSVARAGLLSAQGANARLYYSVRNRVNFERRTLISSKLVYLINMSLALAAQYFNVIYRERSPLQATRKLQIAITAVRDGWAGRLGQRVDI